MITLDELRTITVFATVSEQNLKRVLVRTAEVVLDPGEWLIREGESACFFGVVSGKVEVVKRIANEDVSVADYCAGDSFGEVPLLLAAPSIVSGRATEPSRIARTHMLTLEGGEQMRAATRCRPTSSTGALRRSRMISATAGTAVV